MAGVSVTPMTTSDSLGHDERPLERTSGLLNKADSTAFFRCSIAYQLQGQMHCLQMRHNFAIVVPTVLANRARGDLGKGNQFSSTRIGSSPWA